MRAYFNRISNGVVAGVALGTAMAGYLRFGLPGAIDGLTAGSVLGAALMARESFFRG